MHRFPLIVLATLGASVMGCAAMPPARYVKSKDLGALEQPIAPGTPIVVEFEEGDVIPLTVTIDGPFVKSPEGAAPIQLRVTRHFYLRIDKNGMKSSLDGKTFDWKPERPGEFQVGVGVTREGPKAHISIRTPTPPDPSKP